jgi:hypothetical protein
VEYGKFRTNLNKLRKKLEFQQSSAALNNAALQHYMGLNPVNMNLTGGMKYPRWDLSDAKESSRKILQPSSTRQCNLKSYA